jgi:YVTN family beta-propeller protein
VVSRRSFLAVPFAAACSTHVSGYPGYAFIANQEGQAVAAVDLQAMAAARHIPLDGSPTQVIAARLRPSVFALTPENGTVHEIQSDRLSLKRKLTAASAAITMRLDPHERALYVLAPRALISIALDSLRVEWSLPLDGEPRDLEISPDGKIAAVSSASDVRMIDLAARRSGPPLGEGDFGAVRFLADSRTLIAANRSDKRLSLYETPTARLITHLPIAVRPDHLCFKKVDDGELFITGEGLDAVVVVYPYHTPEVGETVLAGHGPAAMAASDQFLFVASPQSGEVSILNIETRKLIAVVPVGSDPGFVAITPDDQYGLVLNGKSGDVAVLTIQPRRPKPVALLTVIPVGSRPVSVAVRSI